MKRCALLLACLSLVLLLPSCSAVRPDGVIETRVLGVVVAETAPAPPGATEEAPWVLENFGKFTPDAQLAIVEGWNASHGGGQRTHVPWGALIGLVLGGASGSNVLSSVLGAAFGAASKGAANVAVAFKPSVPASWPQAILAGLSILSPVHGVGPERSTEHLAAVAAAKPATVPATA